MPDFRLTAVGGKMSLAKAVYPQNKATTHYVPRVILYKNAASTTTITATLQIQSIQRKANQLFTFYG